jgi:hypothetical protein
MPILKQETKEIILPESGAKLTILSKVTYGTMLKIWETPAEDNSSLLAIASHFITNWDFTDEKGVKLPINFDSLKLLSKDDGQFLIAKISTYFDQKKTSI